MVPRHAVAPQIAAPGPRLASKACHAHGRLFDRHGRVRFGTFVPDVIGSGLAGGLQPAGGVCRCRLVPKPIAPGCWRNRPDVSAASASATVAPPRIKLMRSRRRAASSKSRARTAASISRCKSSTVWLMHLQRASMNWAALRQQRISHSCRPENAVHSICPCSAWLTNASSPPRWPEFDIRPDRGPSAKPAACLRRSCADRTSATSHGQSEQG
jgi:hypothetical protein